MAVRIQKRSGIAEVEASCECGWESNARNALANAARHARASGHVVTVLQQLSVTYAPEGMGKDEVYDRVRYPDDTRPSLGLRVLGMLPTHTERS